jgi:hypothetical protein
MKLRQTLMLCAAVALLAFVGTGQANAQGTRQRPFSDFLNAQNTFFNPSLCKGTTLAWAPPDFSALAIVDYTGKTGDCIQNLHNGPALNSRVDGTVNERDLADGTAEITVNVHFRNVFSIARDFNQGGFFGYDTTELFNHPELTPGLATGNLMAKFIIAHPGDPLPDIAFSLGFYGDFTFVRFGASADGPLRADGEAEGTPAKLVISQTGVTGPGQGHGVADGFPAEIVRVFKKGN